MAQPSVRYSLVPPFTTLLFTVLGSLFTIISCSQGVGCESDSVVPPALTILVTGHGETSPVLLSNARACVFRSEAKDCAASGEHGLIHLPPDVAGLSVEISSPGYLPKLVRLPKNDADRENDYSVTLDADLRTTFILDEPNALLESESGATSLVAGLGLPRNTPVDIAPIGPDTSGLIDSGLVLGGQHVEVAAVTAHATSLAHRRAAPTVKGLAIHGLALGVGTPGQGVLVPREEGSPGGPANNVAGPSWPAPATAPPVNLPQGQKGMAVFVPAGMLEGLSVQPTSLALLYLKDGEWIETPGELVREPRYPWGETCAGCIGTNLFGADGIYGTGDENPALVPGPYPYVISYRDVVPLKVSGLLLDQQGRPVAASLVSLQGADGSGPAASSDDDGSFTLTLLRTTGVDDSYVLSISAQGFRPRSLLVKPDSEAQSLPPTRLTPSPESLRTFHITGPDGAPISDLPVRVKRTPPLIDLSIQNDALGLSFTQSPAHGWQASLSVNGKLTDSGDAASLAARSISIRSEGLWRADLTDAEAHPLSISEVEVLADGPDRYLLAPDPPEPDMWTLIPGTTGLARENLPLGRCYVVEVQSKGLVSPSTTFCEETDVSVALLEATPDLVYQEELQRPFFDAERCTTCHVGPAPAGELDLTALAGFLAGGQTGGIFSPEDPATSRIVRYFLSSRRPALVDALGKLAAQIEGEPMTVPPAVALLGAHNVEIVDGEDLSLTATVFPGTHPITRVSLHVDDREIAAQEPAASEREFAFSPGRLDVGLHTIAMFVTDEAGATAQDSALAKVMPATLAPVTLTVEAPTGDIRDGTGPTLKSDFVDQAAVASGASVHLGVEESGILLLDTDMPATASPLVLSLFPTLGPHIYTITARGVSGETATASVSFNVLPAPAPADFKAILSGTSCTLSWQPVTGASGYRVYYDTDGQAPYQGTGLPEGTSPVTTTATTLTLTSLEEGVTYSFTVAAYTPIAEGETAAVANTSYNLPPRITVTGLASGDLLAAVTTVTANVTDPNGVAQVQFDVGGKLLATYTSAPYTVTLDPATYASPSTLTVTASDTLGSPAAMSLTFYTPAAPPPPPPPPPPPVTLSITSPGAGALLPPQPFTLAASVSNDVAPTTVYFYLDQAPLTVLTAAPYSVSVDPTYFSGGSHVLTAEALDAQGRVAASSVTVTFTQPAVSSPTLMKRVLSNGELHLTGSTLYMPCWDAGTCVFDVSNPSAPSLTSVKPTSAAPFSTSILPYAHSGSADRLWGDGYFFTLGLGAVSLLAGSDPNPSGDYMPLAAGTSTLLTGGGAYVNRTLYVPLALGPTPEIGGFEFSDPSQGRLGLGLKRRSTLPVPSGISNPGLAMMRAGSNLLAAVWKNLSTSQNYLALYDLQLGLKSNTTLTGKIVQSMTLSGTRLYLIVSSTIPPNPLSLEVHDVSNPQIPALLGTYDPSRNLAAGAAGLDLAVSANTAYFSLGASSAPTLLVLDVANPALIFPLGSVGSGSTGMFGKLLATSNKVYATRTTSSGVVITTGLSIVDVSVPSSPSELSYTLLDSTDDEIGLMERQGSYLYALSKWGYAIRTIDAVTLQPVNKIPATSAYASHLTTRPGWLFAVTLFGLRSYSLATPSLPVLSDTLTVTLSTIASLGNYVFGVANATDKFEAIDATDPANLLGPTSLPIPNAPTLTNLACVGSYCYVPFVSPSNGTQGIHVIDVSLPTLPSILSTVSLPSGETPDRVFVSGSHLYMTSTQTGLGPTLRIYDITVGASPSLLSTVLSSAIPPTYVQFALSGQTLCIGSGMALGTPLVCLGVSNPASPNLNLKKALPSAAGLAVAADGSILVSTGSHILHVQP